jgi:hypothetical protein
MQPGDANPVTHHKLVYIATNSGHCPNYLMAWYLG